MDLHDAAAGRSAMASLSPRDDAADARQPLAKRANAPTVRAMKTNRILFVVMSLLPALALAGFSSKPVRYELAGEAFEGTIVWPADALKPLPGILMIPNWMGPTEASLDKARKVAAMGYVVLMADMYGVDVRPQNAQEASAAAGAVRADRQVMRTRAFRALQALRTESGVPLDPQRVAAIGFCFGGGTVLELARSGAALDAVVSFHGDLLSPTLEADAQRTRSRVLVLHGADDPYVPQEHVARFIAAMQGTEADWQLVQFSGAVHSFTDPNAAAPGQAEYHPRTAERAFRYMRALFDEMWSQSGSSR
jgi:dienelactone hydrolase